MSKKKNEGLSSIEWKIYNYLKERTLEDKWTTQQELIDYLNTVGINVSNKRTIRRYIQNIRNSNVIQKIILTSYSQGYRIMSDVEERKILVERRISILKSLKQCNNDIKKFNLNGQMRITTSKYERDYIESLLNHYEKEDVVNLENKEGM